jgi:TonB family protein
MDFSDGHRFYGSVVCLIEANHVSLEWWEELDRHRMPIVYPELDRRLNVVGRTACTRDAGDRFDFVFSGIRPGDYLLYSRVFWGDSMHVSGNAWRAVATVAAGETANVTLRLPTHSAFHAPPVGVKQAGGAEPGDPELPKFGEYVYVEELAEAVTRVPPDYPEEARRAHVDGVVLIHALVDREGRVRDARVVKSIPMLDEAAEKAVRQYVFKPALVNQKPVAAWVAVPVRFSLQ